MSKTYCTSCRDCITDDETRWASDSPYCEDCFDEGFVYCHRCDSLMCRSDAYFDDDGVAYCNQCYEEDLDDDSPDNPDIYDADREQIIELSRNWLLGRQSKRSPIKVNERDVNLIKLRDQVGLVEQPLYVFGLRDREDYQLSASPDLLDQTRDFISFNGLNWVVIEGVGHRRLGIALTIRQDAMRIAVKLIKSLSETKIPVRV